LPGVIERARFLHATIAPLAQQTRQDVRHMLRRTDPRPTLIDQMFHRFEVVCHE
jgi:hypothetical protein